MRPSSTPVVGSVKTCSNGSCPACFSSQSNRRFPTSAAVSHIHHVKAKSQLPRFMYMTINTVSSVPRIIQAMESARPTRTWKRRGVAHELLELRHALWVVETKLTKCKHEGSVVAVPVPT